MYYYDIQRIMRILCDMNHHKTVRVYHVIDVIINVY